MPKGDKSFMPIQTVIVSKVNVMARLEFDLALFHAAVQHFSYYVTKTH